MLRMRKALGAFALTLALALSLAASPLCLPAQAAETADYVGYLVMLDAEAQIPYAADPMGQATLMAAYNERQELLPLAEELGIYKAGQLEDIQNLVWAGQVLVAEPDYQVELFATPDLPTDHDDPTKPDDPFFIAEDYNYQFSLKDSDKHGITVRAAWDAGLTGEGVTVAVIDSGLIGEHVDLPAKVARGRYFFYREEEGGRYKYTVGGVTRSYNYYSNDNSIDDYGHGTMVSGLIAAPKDNGEGIAGIAPNATIIPIRCFTNEAGCLGGLTSNLISGVTYAMDNGADVINMSWGMTNDSAALKTVITQAANSGCIMVAAAGNSGSSTLQYPAAYDNVIGVGATDRNGYLSDFSQRNTSVTVCAPGGTNGGSQIWSLGIASPTEMSKGDGTSFAAPMVTACAALLKEANPSMTQVDFVRLLQGNCDAVLLRPGDNAVHAGQGLINLKKLLDAAGCTGATLRRDGDTLIYRAAYHPAQSASEPAENSIILLGGYNAAGHLLASQVATAGLSSYGAYTLSATFTDPDIATLRAFYLKNDASLAAAADPEVTTAR